MATMAASRTAAVPLSIFLLRPPASGSMSKVACRTWLRSPAARFITPSLQLPSLTQACFKSTDANSTVSPNKIYTFEDVASLIASPSSDRILIDVREPSELKATGRIPGAQNLPINSSPDALFLSAEDFEDRFGFPKPKANDEVIFYCKAGVRSRTAAGLARMGGWEKVGEYPGSWNEWELKGGKVEGS